MFFPLSDMGDEEPVKLEQIVVGKKKRGGRGGRKEKISQCVIKEWQLSQKKSWNFQKEHNPRPSLLHTPTRAVFVGCRDNNGSWRSRDRRLPTLTALRYVMNVWLPPRSPPQTLLSTLHQYGAANVSCAVHEGSRTPCGGQVHKNNTVCIETCRFLFVNVQLAICEGVWCRLNEITCEFPSCQGHVKVRISILWP